MNPLDALTRIEMQQLIERIWQEQQFSVFLITHDVDEAVMLGDCVLLIEHGQVSLDMPISLPRPRQRKSQAFVTLTEDILERVMADHLDMPISLPRPRQRKSQAFVTLTEDILERVMADHPGLMNTKSGGVPEVVHAYYPALREQAWLLRYRPQCW